LHLTPTAMGSGDKRKAEEAAPGPSTKKASGPLALAVNPKRVRELKPGPVTGTGPVIYW
jgi:hypothetical protein